jgi:hypothetical protein
MALVAVTVGCSIYGVETFLLRSRHRFMESPAEVMMRAFGLAHFLVGWLFLFTSPRLRSQSALAWLGASTLLGITLCVAFHIVGAGKNPFAVMAFYGVFLIHEVRDEAHLYQAYDRPRQPNKILSHLSLAVAALLLSVLAAAYLVNGLLKQNPTVTDTPFLALLLGLAGLSVLTIWLVRRLHLAAVEEYDGLHGLAAAHGPLLLVYAGILAILVVGSFLGSVGFNLIILIHVTAWLVFVHHQLDRQPSKRPGCWSWLRTTSRGFLVLHLGMVLFVLVLLALRVHVWQRSGWLSHALAGSSFPYWSLMHIGMSLRRGD